MKIKLLPIVCLFLLSLSCTTTKQNGAFVVDKRHAQFRVGVLPDTWEQKSFRNTDLFFEHTSKDASIYLSVQCEQFSDSPLEALMAQMLVELGRYEVLSQQRITLAKREALVTEVKVNLDGVDRFVKIMVLRKNRCLFDAVLSSRTQSDELVRDFDTMVNTFNAEADL